ncbi:hypothetical protein [Chitinolyticbacter meiyuanensis]|uniref:hypothetical protein n=1 Tax=Chitinolyticbacter meiyuanensis TaxID=682798 RepID=UPI0011E59FBD|nr:hypothetical protein [Chitinolyticbacter meiyuanensis]
MPTEAELLANLTFKEEGIETERRIFYTLCGHEPAITTEEKQRQQLLQLHRTTKLLALFGAHLVETGQITHGQLDSMLLEIAR